MDSNTRVIIDVTLTSEEANQRAKDLGVSIQAIKDEQKELRKSGKETDVAFQSNASQLRKLTAEQKAYITIADQANGSNNQLRAQLSLLTAQYNAMGREERNTTVAGQALTVQMKGLSDEIKVNEERVGDYRRSVGDYEKANRSATDSIKQQGNELSSLGNIVGQAPIGFQILGKQVGEVKNQIQNFRQASQEAKITQQEFTVAQKIATEATKASEIATAAATAVGFKFSQGQATAADVQAATAIATDSATVAIAAQTTATEAQVVATAAATSATKVFKVALASTGIGAIIILVAALINYLKDFDPLVDTIEQLFAGFKAGIDVVGRVITGFITNIKSVGDLFSKLGSLIAHPIDSFKSLGTEMNAAAKAAMALKAAQQDLNDQLSIQDVLNAKAQQQIKELMLQSKNRSKSDAERRKLAQDAQAIETKNFEQRSALADKEYEQAVQNANIRGKLSKEDIEALRDQGTEYAYQLQNRIKNSIGQKELDAIKAAELGKVKIKEESTGTQERLQNIADAAAERSKAAEEKRLADVTKSREKAADAENVRLESLLKTNESILTSRQKEIASVNQEIDEKVAKYKKYGATTEQLEKERVARIKQITDQFHKDDLAQIDSNNKVVQDILVASIKNEGDRRLAQLQLNQSREIDATNKDKQAVQDRITKGETGLTDLLKSFDDKKTAILSEGTLARQELIKSNYQTELDAFNQQQVNLANAQTANAGTDAQKLEAKQMLLDAQYQMDMDHANLVGQDTTLIVAQYEQQKRQAQLDTIDTVESGFKSFSSSFQSLVSENSTAYKVAGAIQARVDAAQALRNNILIIQENIKAIASQGKLPFPLNIVAIVSTLAALGGAVLAAKNLVSPVKLATGGIFESDGRGTILSGPGSGTSDSINARLSNGEAVINARSTRMFQPMLSAINMAGGGAALSHGSAMAAGGISQGLQGGHLTQSVDRVLNAQEIADIVIAGVKASPPQQVDVRDITTSQMRTKQATIKANI
jgi:hypothetical protein